MNKSKKQCFAMISLAVWWSGAALVTASAQDVQQLGNTLTLFGAEKAGSVDGAIPPYTGGIAALPNLPTPTGGVGYPSPFANEAPLFKINASNISQYENELTPGAQALLRRYPDYYMNIYPSHRTMSYPAWVLANTVKNATSAHLEADGEGVVGAYGGIPFPIPQNGNEVMWNNYLAYRPANCHEYNFQNYLIDASGNVTFLGDADNWWIYPYYNKNTANMPGNFFLYDEAYFHTPAATAGTTYLFQYPIDFDKTDNVTWFYDPGTRRVRIAPEFKYDTPIASYGGAIDFDEVDLFYGEMNKFDFKLVGKKTMIVPYNVYGLSQTTESAVLGVHTLNPQVLRWERHRVWEIDATLRPGERHIYSKWVFYIDEDSWLILATESYDHAGAIYRVGFLYPYQDYSDGEAASFPHTFGIYDLSKGNYELSRVHTKSTGRYACSETLPNMSNFTPQAMAAQGVQ